MADDRFTFITEWYDPNACLTRKYQMFYYPIDNSVELFDIKQHRKFLKRTKQEHLSPKDVYVGSTVNVFSRQMLITSFADEFTRKNLGERQESVVGLILPDAMTHMGAILESINKAEFVIVNMKMVQLSKREAYEFMRDKITEGDVQNLVLQHTAHMSSAPVLAFEIMGNDVIHQFGLMVGSADPAKARAEQPISMRARYGTDTVRSALYVSRSREEAAFERDFFFSKSGAKLANTSTLRDCTCAVIKPHAMTQAGRIIEGIQLAGFQITALEQFSLEKVNAEEFLEVYRGVVQEYSLMVNELTSGACIAMEIKATERAQERFRELCGPMDPEIARQLRPQTLRAQFGISRVQNAVHCTDLPEDGPLECEYFFKILDRFA